ncbi:MAG TPA: protein kinase [Polyangiaceae bacterium]|nr:protein kinase [Polyangiaceae bacterium]
MKALAFARLPPETLFHGRYRVIRRLKAGGVGAVYEVVDEITGRRRALKIMLPAALESADLRARFAREARITGDVESDHIVQVFDAGVEAGSGAPFLVMELLRGEELGALCARRGPLPPAEALLYLSQIAHALEKTHAAGVIHRDLKPENVFVTSRDDGTVCVKILDFGLAKAVAPGDAAPPTVLMGTPLYMAPEQFRGDGRVGPGADIYALAHLAYVLLAGAPYWLAEAKATSSAFVLFQKIMAGLPEAPSARAARRGVRLPPGFDAWFRRATEVEPARRLDRATAAVAELAEALGARASPPGQAAMATPPRPATTATLPGQAAMAMPSGQAAMATPPRQAAMAMPPGQAAMAMPPRQRPRAPEAGAAVAPPRGAEALKVIGASGRPLLGRCFPLTESPTRLGRGRGDHVRLEHPDVDEAHAQLRRGAEGWVLERRDQPGREVLLKRGDRFLLGPFALRLVDYDAELERDRKRRRRSFSTVPLELVLGEAFERAREGHQPLAVLRFELERPESVTQVHGEAAVFRILDGMAALLWRTLREHDASEGAVASHGRQLFLVLPGGGRGEARALARSALKRLNGQAFRVSPTDELRVSVRLQVAHLEAADHSWRELLARLLDAREGEVKEE